MARAQELTQTLLSPQWDVLSLIRARVSTDARAAAIIDAVTSALNDDEHVTALNQQLSAQHRLALQLLEQPVQPPAAPVNVSTPSPSPAQPVAPAPGVRQVQRRSASVSAIRDALREVEEALAADPELRADIDCRVYRPGKGEASQ